MPPPRLDRLVQPGNSSFSPPKPSADVLANLPHNMSTVDLGKAVARPRGAPLQQEATDAPALSGWYGEKRKSEQQAEPYAPMLLIVQPPASAAAPASNISQRECETSTTPTQTQAAAASSQHTKADGGEKQDDAAVPAAASTQPTTQDRKRGIDALDESLTPESPASFAPLDTSRETLVFGGLAAESAVRWRPSLISSMPTFKISIRQNHFTGNQSDENSQARTRAKALGRPLPEQTRHGLPAHLYSDDHLEEEFEFDFSDMKIFSIQEVDRSSERLEELMGYIGVAVPADGTFGLIQWCMKDGLRPTRTRFQIASFPQDSSQATCRDILKQRQSRLFAAVVPLGKPYLRRACQRYMDLVNFDRYLTLDGKPRNDWYLSRFPEYSPDALNRFHEYQRCTTLALPVPSWLVHTGTDGKSTYAPIYRAEPHVVPQKTLVNVSVYESHFMSALLYDRDERNALQTQQYSYNHEYPARVQELSDGEYSFDIQIKGDGVALGGQKLIPMSAMR